MSRDDFRTRDPKTKEELLNRMLSFDFDGDIRHLGKEEARISRIARNRLALFFPASGKTFELAVRLPRSDKPRSIKPPPKSRKADKEPET